MSAAHQSQAEVEPTEQAPDVLVSRIVGEGVDARRVVHVGSWTLFAPVAAGDPLPLISELELGRRLKYARPESFVQVIDRLVTAGKFNENEFLHKSWENRAGRGRPRNARGERLLTKEQALLATTQADTPTAWALTREMVHVFNLAHDGLLPPSATSDLSAIVSAALAPLSVRLDAIDQRALARDMSCGEISYEQDMWLKGETQALANMRMMLGHNATFAGAVTSINQRIASAAEWGGTGTKRAGMPADRFPRVRVALQNIRKDLEAEARLRKVSLKGTGSSKSQGNLFDTTGRPANKQTT